MTIFHFVTESSALKVSIKLVGYINILAFVTAKKGLDINGKATRKNSDIL